MKTKIFFLGIILFSLSFEKCLAFMNIEALRQNRDLGFKGETGLRFSASTGNTDKTNGHFNSMNAYRSEHNEFLFLTHYEYGESRKIKNANRGSFHMRQTRYLTDPQIGIEIFSQMQFDEFKKLNSRVLLGGGLRRALYFQDKFRIYGGLGSFYEWEGIKDLENQNTARLNSYISALWLFSSQANASLILYYQPSLEKFQDSRLIIDSGLRFHLSRFVRVHVDLALARDTRPPPEVRRTDMSYLTGFSIQY